MAHLSCSSSFFAMAIALALLHVLTTEVASRSVENLRVMNPLRNGDADGGIKVISKHSWMEEGFKPMPMAHYRKKTKVDTQKFRQCIFFQLCSKSECFHYGRYNTCS